MKKITFSLFFITLSFLCTAQEIQFYNELHDFGKIQEGTFVTYEFEFVNSGYEDLVIEYAKSTCGCTVLDYSQDTIPPKQKGAIKVTFDSNDRPGLFIKSITVKSNAKESIKVLYLKGDVVASNKTRGFSLSPQKEEKVTTMDVLSQAQDEDFQHFLFQKGDSLGVLRED